MKSFNILTILALAGMVVSCAKDKMVVNCSENEQPKYRINATIQGNPETRTYMGEEDSNQYPVYWSDGDKIAVFSKTSAAEFELSKVDPDDTGTDNDRTEAVFEGDAGDMPIKFEGSDVYAAAYPADKAFAMIDTEDGMLLVGSYVPNLQTYKTGSFNDNTFPMAATSTDGENFDFYNLGGIIQLRVWGDEDPDDHKPQRLQSIYLVGKNDEVVAGGVGMKFDPLTGIPNTTNLEIRDNGKKIATYGDEGYTRCMLDFSTIINDPDRTPNSGDEYRGLELSTDNNNPTVINIAVIPQVFENGIMVEMRDAKNMGLSKETTPGNSVTVRRSMVTRMSEFEYVKPEALSIANSYIYSEPGYYVMPAYAMGNRMDVLLDTKGRNLDADLLWSELITVNHNTTDRAHLLPAVTNIEYLTFDDGYNMLQFKINKDPNTGNAYRGNAAIALYDKDTKEVIWSWHVWMCEPVHDVVTGGSCSAGTYSYELPDGTKVDYAAEASSGQLVIMDRNLGAISANPADGWKTYGLYYQNGRRDPFIGGHWDGNPATGTKTTFGTPKDNLSIRLDESAPFNVDPDVDVEMETAPVWYNEELAPKGWNWLGKYQDISTALRFPMTFSAGYNDNNGQWTDFEDSDNKSWMDPNVGGGKKKGGNTSGGVHGNTGLSDGGHQAYWNRTKTIMDPCPVGYSVLGEEGGVYFGGDTKTYIFEDAGGTAAGIVHPDHGVYGIMSQKSGYSQIWWPAAGVRTISGYLGGVGYQGMYFYYDHIAADHGGHGMAFNNGGGYKDGMMTNQAASVRCVREKQFGDLDKYPLK